MNDNNAQDLNKPFKHKNLLRFAAVIIPTIIFLISFRHHKFEIDPAMDWVMILSPVIPNTVAILVALDYIFIKKAAYIDDKRDFVVFVQIVLILFTTGICFLLTEFHSWNQHISFLASLFLLFVVWDIVMVLLVTKNETKQEIITGNLTMNCPSLIAIAAVGALASRLTDPTQQSIFVIGMVSFHLVVSSVGYFFMAICSDS